MCDDVWIWPGSHSYSAAHLLLSGCLDAEADMIILMLCSDRKVCCSIMCTRVWCS